MDAWHIAKWSSLAVVGLYLVIQIAALLILKGELRRQSGKVVLAVLVLAMAPDLIGDIFDSQFIHRVGIVATALASIVAAVILMQMFRAQKEPKGRIAQG